MQWKSLIVAAALAAAVPTLSYAQAAPADPNAGGGNGGNGGGRGNRGGGQGGGNWDPAKMEQMMLDRMKTDMGAQDDEWKVIEPKLRKVMEDQRDLRSGMRGGPGGFGGRRGPGGFGGGGGGGGGGGPGGGDPTAAPAPTTPVAKAAADLQTALKAGVADDGIDKKLSAYRDVRDKAKTDMAADQKDLKSVLTAKQEASLVLTGMLD